MGKKAICGICNRTVALGDPERRVAPVADTGVSGAAAEAHKACIIRVNKKPAIEAMRKHLSSVIDPQGRTERTERFERYVAGVNGDLDELVAVMSDALFDYETNDCYVAAVRDAVGVLLYAEIPEVPNGRIIGLLKEKTLENNVIEVDFRADSAS